MKNSLFLLLVRAMVYLLAIAGLVQLITWEGYAGITPGSYGEQSLIERMQVVLALVSGALFMVVAVVDRGLRPAAVMVSGLMLMMLIREADFFLDVNVFDGAWQLLVSLVLVVVAVYLWRQPDSIGESVGKYAAQASAGILLSGLLVTLVFSRLFGRASFWQAVMGEDYMRVVKTIAEEGTELLGYGLVFIAALELLAVSLRATRSRAR